MEIKQMKKLSTFKICILLMSSLLLISVFSFIMTARIGLDADSLYPFSFSKDVLTHIPIQNWSFPGPLFFMPDVLLSIPLVAIFKTPNLWIGAFSTIQQICMILIFTFFTKEKEKIPLITRFSICVYFTIACYVVLRILFGTAFGLAAGTGFLAAFHMSSALAAFLCFFILKPEFFEKSPIQKTILFSVIFFILGLSDLFFALYFFSLAAPYFFLQGKKLFYFRAWCVALFILAIAVILGILTDYKMNPSFMMEFQNHSSVIKSTPLSKFIFFKNLAGTKGMLLFLVLPLALLPITLFQKKQQLTALLLGLELLSMCIIFLGLCNDRDCLRYFNLFAPVLIFILLEITPIPEKIIQFITSIVVSCVLIAGLSVFGHKKLKNYHFVSSRPEFSSILTCESARKIIPGSIIVSTYWPGKVLFEDFNRTASFAQVNGNLKITPWISNPAWENILRNPAVAVIPEFGLNPAIIKTLLAQADAKTLCNGKLIRVPFSKIKNMIETASG